MEDKKLTEKESLELISQMIRNTQNRMEKNSGTMFLVWGYLTVIITLIVWILILYTHNLHVQWIWFLLPAGGGLATWLYNKKEKKVKAVTTYVDRVVGYIWLVMGILGFSLSVFSIFSPLYGISFPIFFIIILIMGSGTIMTGLVIRFKPIIYGGIICMLLAFAFPFLNWMLQMPLFALIFVIMMIIPGHILNYAGRKTNQK